MYTISLTSRDCFVVGVVVVVAFNGYRKRCRYATYGIDCFALHCFLLSTDAKADYYSVEIDHRPLDRPTSVVARRSRASRSRIGPIYPCGLIASLNGHRRATSAGPRRYPRLKSLTSSPTHALRHIDYIRNRRPTFNSSRSCQIIHLQHSIRANWAPERTKLPRPPLLQPSEISLPPQVPI